MSFKNLFKMMVHTVTTPTKLCVKEDENQTYLP